MTAWNPETAKQRLTELANSYRKHFFGTTDVVKANRADRTERDVIQQFIIPLLRDVLGWPVEDPNVFQYELHTEAGRPDMVLTLPDGSKLYIEAKRFGIIKELPHQSRKVKSRTLRPDQLAQPGMSPDRTKEEQQAINYAFENNGTWAILTNFEHLRLYNARRDWLVLAFEDPFGYLEDFDLFQQLSWPALQKGQLDAMSNQRLRADIDLEYLSFINEARENLARDIVTHPKDNPWAIHPNGLPVVEKIREVVQRYLDRMVLLRFAEDHFVITADTLRMMVDLVLNNHYAPTLDFLIDNVFRQFDKRHNSALFAHHLADDAVFSQAALIKLVDRLYGARYRAFAADILGNTYEQYLGKRLALDGHGDIRTADNLETRKKQGSYYTPQVLVQYLVRRTLGRTLYGTLEGTPDGTPAEGEARKTFADIAHLRVLDPSCGSGSFLIAAYAVLKEFYEAEIERIRRETQQTIAHIAQNGGSQFDIELGIATLKHQADSLEDYPKRILEHHLYGVDLDPQAAELAVVNLMMRAMERRGGKANLPLILNQNVKVGNSLVGVMPDDPRWQPLAPQLAELIGLRRSLLALSPGDDHTPLESAIARVEKVITDALASESASFDAPDRIRPFHWPMAFPEVFFGEDGAPLPNPGFSIVLGNPPWEILKPDLREFYAQFDPRLENSSMKRAQVEARIRELDQEDPERAVVYAQKTTDIEQTTRYTRASAAYGQQGTGDPATQKLFTERGWRLLQPDGRLGFVIPSGIYTDLGTRELRQMLFEQGRVEALIGLSNVKNLFPQVDSRFKFSLLAVTKGQQTERFPAIFRVDLAVGVDAETFGALVNDPKNWFTCTLTDIRRFSPESLSVMEFQSRKDYQIADKLYADHPLIGQTVEGTWNLKFTREFDMTNDRGLFNTAGVGLPLYEGKMIHQFTHTHEKPKYWVKEEKGAQRLARKTGDGYKRARLVFRDIARATDNRSLISAVIPPMSFIGNTAIVETQLATKEMLYVAAMLNSFCMDAMIRYKIATHVNIFYLNQLPLPRLTSGHPTFDALVRASARLTCTTEAYAEVWREATGEPWMPASAVTQPEARQALRDEVDARVAHLFGLSWDEFAHVLGSFRLAIPEGAVGRARLAALERAYVEVAP